jgi:hypothetical protein
MLSEQPLVNSTYGLYQNLKKGKYGEFAGNLLSGYVPASAMVRSISEVGDSKERTGSGYKAGEKILDEATALRRQARGFRNSFLKGIPVLRNYFVDESTAAVSDAERGGVGRRILRVIDPFNIRSNAERPPKPPKKFTKSNNGASEEETRLVEDAHIQKGRALKVMDLIEQARVDGRESAHLEDALREKVGSKLEKGTLTKEEAERANRLLNLSGKDAYKGQVEDKEEPEARSEKGFIDKLSTYAEAIGTDPFNAAGMIFSGETILRLDNGTIIVQRMTKEESQAIKKKRGGTKVMKLDHKVPLQLGGDNSESNLELVSEEDHASYTPVENYLGAALKQKKISGKDAQQLIRDFKEKKITFEDIKRKL